MSTLSKKIKRNREFNVFFNENFTFGDDSRVLKAAVIQLFVSSNISNCTMNQARTLLENILGVKEIDDVKHYTGVIAIKPNDLCYYYEERDEFKKFIKRDFVKDTTAPPILKSKMIEYFRFFAIGDGIRVALSKVEKELDKHIDSQIIDTQKYYVGYKYIEDQQSEIEDIDL